MKKSILDIIRENSEVKEMGIRQSKLKSLLPTNYLLKTTKKEVDKKERRKEIKPLIAKCEQLYKSIVTDFKNIKWWEIDLHLWDGFFYIVFPQEIKDKIFELSEAYEILDNEQYTQTMSNREKIEQLYKDYNQFIYTDYIYSYVDLPRNRTHFPKGLPKSLLGFGLGIKIYRKMLDTLKFMQSEPNATKEVQAIYLKLVESPDVNCVIYKDLALLIDKRLTKDEKVEILSQSIYERYYKKPYAKRLVLNKTIVLDTALIREIGVSNFNYINDIVYTYTKSNPDGAEPFSNMEMDFNEE